ncbi:MAG: hypothetical protein ACAH59_03825 [Pseudobdellovibrionaceae bacterium]
MSREIAKHSAMDFNLLMKFWQALRKVALPLFIITLIGTSLDQWITMKMESMLMAPQGTSPLVWLYGAFSLLLSLMYPLASSLVALSGSTQESPLRFLKRFFEQSLIEQMRSWGSIMLWSFLLILPGLYRFLQLLFVPFVVCFDSIYQVGDRDALQTSRALAKGQLLKLLVLFFLFSIFIPGVFTVFDEWKMIWKTPVSALFICLLEMLVQFCFIQILWRLFIRRMKHESSLSMERH